MHLYASQFGFFEVAPGPRLTRFRHDGGGMQRGPNIRSGAPEEDLPILRRSPQPETRLHSQMDAAP